MNKIFYASTCSTCARIMKELNVNPKTWVIQDITKEPLKPEQLDEMVKHAGSHEALFSKIAIKYRSLGLNTKKLTERDFRKWMLKEYTFLKRPVMKIGQQWFIGNSPKSVKGAAAALKGK